MLPKANQLQSLQGYGKQRANKNIHESKKQKKSVAMLPILAETRYQLPVNGQQRRVIQRERQNNIHVKQDGYNN